MLQKLHIRNFAIIEEVNVEFGLGFNVLTGETGAGKSILVDALASLLGSRLSSDVVRPHSKTAIIEASFELSDVQLSAVKEALSVQDVDVASTQLSVRRELTESGRSRSLVNDHVVGVAALKAIAPAIIDLNMQGEHYALNASRNQLNILDQYAGCLQLRKRVEALYQERLYKQESLRELKRKLEEGRRARDFIEFQLTEIAKVNPQPGEDEALLAERMVLANQDKISNLEREIYNSLYEEEDSIASRLNSVRKQLGSLSSLDTSYTNHLEQLEAANVLVTDVAEEVFSIHSNRTWSEDRLGQVETRLSDIERLKRKYGNSLEEVLAARESLQSTLEQIENGSSKEAEAISELKRIEELYLSAAAELSAGRRRAAKPFAEAIAKGLRGLSLPDVKFVIEVKDLQNRGAEDPEAPSGVWSPTGLDRVDFMFSANKGMALKPLAQVASGGELSRLSLIIQSVCRDSLSRETSFASTLLLDEVDVGVSGQVAETLGRNLAALSRKQQIVCITHQPQIARFADSHFVVKKTNTEDNVRSDVVKLTHKQRVKELARLIAADENAEVAQQTADWLLQHN